MSSLTPAGMFPQTPQKLAILTRGISPIKSWMQSPPLSPLNYDFFKVRQVQRLTKSQSCPALGQLLAKKAQVTTFPAGRRLTYSPR